MMRLFKIVICASILLLFSFSVRGEGIKAEYTKQDSLLYEAYVKAFSGQQTKPFEELVINTAKYFIGKPYVGSTLEIADDQGPVVNLREFDCVTLVETSIALSGTIKSQSHNFENYCKVLSYIRYRNGKPKGYTSRSHYTSDWIFENQNKDILKDITLEIGGENIAKQINFMSQKFHLYKSLKDNPENLEEIKKLEKAINDRNSYNVLPVSSIAVNQKDIKNGDIIAFATALKGLDYSHMGIAYWQNDKLHFIHASSIKKQVVIETKTLLEYCQSSKNCTGITILRINE